MLLLSYLDKICLALTGELRRALACLYSEARLYKGAREASLSQSTTLHSTGSLEQRGSWPKQFYIDINVFMIKEAFTMSSLSHVKLFLKN